MIHYFRHLGLFLIDVYKSIMFVMQVCLDGTTTTEKELDTVEVLKAIQKAKEAKDRMANNEKKVFWRFYIYVVFF